jgi:hypothetical protein
MYQQLWGYKVEEKLYLGVREQKRLNTTGLEHSYNYNGIVERSDCDTKLETFAEYAQACLRQQNLAYSVQQKHIQDQIQLSKI